VIVGLGTDVVSIERIGRLYQRQGDRFLDRVYVDGEKDYCLKARDPSERLAARWAAKEAALKALGTGVSAGCRLDLIEVHRDADSGAPSLLLHGACAERAAALGADRFHLSLSHSAGVAMATVIFERTLP
jgi:holo-[acyl-carrier protein] synthase